MILQLGDSCYAIAAEDGERGEEVEYGEVATLVNDEGVFLALVIDPDDEEQFKVFRTDPASFPTGVLEPTTTMDVEFEEDEDEPVVDEPSEDEADEAEDEADDEADEADDDDDDDYVSVKNKLRGAE